MRRYILICLTLALATLTSACRFLTYFVVVNSSNGQLEVTYELKPSGMMPHEDVRNPRVLAVEKFNSGNFEWRELPQGKFAIDKERGIVKAQVAANEVLQIEDEDSYYVDKEPNEHFDIKKLNLNGVNGSVTYEGGQFFKQFIKEDKSWISPGGTVYVIYYR